MNWPPSDGTSHPLAGGRQVHLICKGEGGGWGEGRKESDTER